MSENLVDVMDTSIDFVEAPLKPATSRWTLSAALRTKRTFDVTAVSIALLLFAPFLLTIALVSWSMQGGPIFIRHKRVGRDGALFPCLKFRTMMVDGDRILRDHLSRNPAAAAEWHVARKLKDDPRVTPLGRVMRKLSIDELPQFINVLRGEMSLVGPRPIVMDEAHHYGPHLPIYKSVRPGLTGLWQIGGRSDVSYAERVRMDCEYVANWSLWRDLYILMKTVPAVLFSKGSY